MLDFVIVFQWLTKILEKLVLLSEWLLRPLGWIVLAVIIGLAAFLPGKGFRRMLDPFFWVLLVGAVIVNILFWNTLGYVTLLFFVPAAVFVLVESERVAKEKKVICRLGGFEWDRNDFCRGWLITGTTGCGKTQGGINNLLHQVFQNETAPPWGGVCIDEKGLYYEILVKMAETYSRSHHLKLLQTRPADAPADWRPPAIFNLLSNDKIPSGTYATAIVDTAAALSGGEGDKGFFKTQAHSQIAKGIDLLRVMGRSPTLTDLYDILQNQNRLKACLAEISPLVQAGNRDAIALDRHFTENFLKQPPDQLGGVIGTIYNYLNYFTHPEIAEVFCNANQTFDLSEIDQGAIVCVAMPQKFATERRYVSTILKLLFYQHVLNRFDNGKDLKSGRKNIVILWQDEAQRFVTVSDGNVDVIREAYGTTVMACQSKMSLVPPLGGKEKAQVTMLNLRNRIIMQAGDRECADMSADFVGKKMVWKKSYSHSDGGRSTSVSRSEEEQYHVKPHELMEFEKYTAIITHAAKGWKKSIVPPISPDGTLPDWYEGDVPFWFKAKRKRKKAKA